MFVRMTLRRLILLALLVLIAFMIFFYQYSSISKYNLSKDDSQLFPSDHLSGVRLEIDGDINRDYLREILFGLDHDSVVLNDKPTSYKLIKKMFYKYDKNRDKFLDIDELHKLITFNINEHINQGKLNHAKAFNMLKSSKTNLISWPSFVTHYLIYSGYHPSLISNVISNKKYELLKHHHKMALENLEHLWQSCDLNNDNQLSSDEYLTFLHPELDRRALLSMVEKIMNNLDINSDDRLTITEWVDAEHLGGPKQVTPYPGYIDESANNLAGGVLEPNVNNNAEMRSKVFKQVIDLNSDGFASRNEIINYLDPCSYGNAKADAEEIIKKIDENHDGKLAITELLKNYQKVINSKLVNVAHDLHKNDL